MGLAAAGCLRAAFQQILDRMQLASRVFETPAIDGFSIGKGGFFSLYCSMKSLVKRQLLNAITFRLTTNTAQRASDASG